MAGISAATIAELLPRARVPSVYEGASSLMAAERACALLFLRSAIPGGVGGPAQAIRDFLVSPAVRRLLRELEPLLRARLGRE
jgi:hypothetical protein